MQKLISIAVFAAASTALLNLASFAADHIPAV